MTSKTEFLANITKRLGQTEIIAPQKSISGAPDFWQGHELPASERLRKFIAEAEELGASASVYSDMASLRSAVSELLQQLQPSKLLTWRGDFLADWQLAKVLAEWDVLDWQQDSFLHDALAAKVGITAVDFAIAETGSLVLCTNVDKARVASLVPDVHIALVRAEQIRTRMGEVLDEITQMDMPSSVHFITGPSRSSDIENDLSIGVHGPAALYVFVLEVEG
jgi:L-lactate dehydrogenase complex protein LldG